MPKRGEAVRLLMQLRAQGRGVARSRPPKVEGRYLPVVIGAGGTPVARRGFALAEYRADGCGSLVQSSIAMQGSFNYVDQAS